MPMVIIQFQTNLFWLYLSMMLLLPTPESPIIMSLRIYQKSGWEVFLLRAVYWGSYSCGSVIRDYRLPINQMTLYRNLIYDYLLSFITMNKHNKSSHISQIQLSASMKNLGLKLSDIQHIQSFKQKYQKTVEQPIKVIEQIYSNNLPQKCLLHKNTFTLYCQTDQKALCANCVFQNYTHRTHKVFPIKNCTEIIRADSDHFQIELDTMLSEILGVLDHVNSGIQDMEDQFPNTIAILQKYYSQIHELLLYREKQHVNEMKLYKQKMKYEYAILSTQLRRTAVYIQQKLNQYKSYEQQREILTKHSVFSVLKASSTIVAEQINHNIKKAEYCRTNYEIFDHVKNAIQFKMPKLLSQLTIFEDNHKNTAKKSKNRTPSKSPTPTNRKNGLKTQKSHNYSSSPKFVDKLSGKKQLRSKSKVKTPLKK